VGCLLTSAALLAWFVARCRRHPAPVLDLSLLRLSFFTAANLAGFVFSMAFFAMFFTNIQFLQDVWRYSVVGSGAAMTPGPLMAAIFAAPAGRMAQRYGHRRVIVPGLILFIAGIAMLVAWAGEQPDYWRLWFPAMSITGIGVGLTISTLASASNAYLPPARFAMGSATFATGRQVGAALGIAAVTALRTSTGETLLAFQRSWVFLITTAALAAVVMLSLYRPPTEAEVSAARLTPTEAALEVGRPA
jgi:MFS family permease